MIKNKYEEYCKHCSEMEMVVQVRDVAHLYHVIDRLRHLPSVMEVLRKTANEE